MDRCIELTKKGELPTLLQMAHQPENDDKIVALVALNIVALDSYLHLNNRLTEQEVETIARDIVQVYGGALSFADLNLILTNARRGAYGKFYERLSGVDIMKWISEYYDERLGESATQTRYERESRAPRYKSKGVTKTDAEYRIYKDKLRSEGKI